jgi:processive 1,2-diacylglycerol beta-glucosyltransferase
MAAADVIVTKPGGLSLSEALAVGRPMVLTRPLPGHEEANARMLERAGAALLARSGNDVRGALDRMLDDPGLRMRMTVPVRALARPEAAANIAAILTTRLRIPVAA